MDFERRKFVRWLSKYHPQNGSIILPLIAQLAERIEKYEFSWVDKSLDGNSVLIPDIEFNRRIDQRNYEFILIGFDKNGKLQFQCCFGKSTLNKWNENEEEYYLTTKVNNFVKVQSDSYYRAKLWGARWYHCDKVSAFQRHWQKLIEAVPALIEYLDTEKSHPNIR